METNVDTSIDTGGAPPPDTSSFDRDTETTERRSVRDELRQQFDEARERGDSYDEERPIPGQAERRSGTQGEQEERQRTEQQTQQTQQQEPPQQQQQQQQTTQTQPPQAWAKEARDVWATVPPQAQAAIIKREQDIQNGVNQLRQYYGEIDQAIAPFQNDIKGFNKTPGQAVAQLFAWFDALAKNPDQAFPALLRSYNYDPRRLAAAFGFNQQFKQDPKVAQQQQQQQQIKANQERFQNYIDQLVQQKAQQYIAPVQQQFQEQQAAKTYEMLEYWARDKPYFEHVRATMGTLLTPDPNTGQSMIPLKDGKVDLDAAYEAACRMNPEINQQLWDAELKRRDEARKAEELNKLKAQKGAAEKARRASGSLTSSAPGAAAARNQAAASKGKGKSVRESLNEALGEYRR